jgi:hypothetical protein
MKIDTALYNIEKRHQLEGYFIVDTILSLSHPGTLAVSYPPVYGRRIRVIRSVDIRFVVIIARTIASMVSFIP